MVLDGTGSSCVGISSPVQKCRRVAAAIGDGPRKGHVTGSKLVYLSSELAMAVCHPNAVVQRATFSMAV